MLTGSQIIQSENHDQQKKAKTAARDVVPVFIVNYERVPAHKLKNHLTERVLSRKHRKNNTWFAFCLLFPSVCVYSASITFSIIFYGIF